MDALAAINAAALGTAAETEAPVAAEAAAAAS